MWAPEENRQLKELRERLGMAARLESNIESFGSATSGCSATGSAPAMAASESFAVGNRVRVVRGRKFHDFGAGDAGTVLRVDADGGVCTVAFDGRSEPLQVAMRHLETEPARRQPRSAACAFEPVAEDQANTQHTMTECAATSLESREEQCEARGGDGILRAADLNLKVELPTTASTGLASAASSMGVLETRPAPGATGETPSLALLSGESDSRRLRMADSGTGSSAGCMRRSASQPAGEPRILEMVPRTDVPSSGVAVSPLKATQSDGATASLCSNERLPFRTHQGALGMTLSSAWPSATLPPAPVQLDAAPVRCDPAVSSTVQNAAAPSSNQDMELCTDRSAERQDPLRKEAAEIRRAADAAAAAEYRREAALFIEQHGAHVAAREEAEALADAVQASAHATATATATAMVEVAALRVEVSELQTHLSKEAEQRSLSVRELERSLEQLRAKQERTSTDAEDAIKAEQKRLSRKQAELVSLCLSLQKDQEQQETPADASVDWEQFEQRLAALDHGLEVSMRSQERAAEQLRSLEDFSTSSVEERRLFEERVAALEAGVNALNAAFGTLDTLDHSHAVERKAREEMLGRLEQKEQHLMELERRLLEVDSGVLVGAERLEALSARSEALAAGLALKADREASPAAAGRIDALASRIDTLVMDLAAKAERETPVTALASVHVVEALSARLDRLTESLGAEVSRVETRAEALHRNGLQEGAAALANAMHTTEQREAEQLQRLSSEAERHAAELQEAAAEVERRASEAIAIGQRAREALDAHCVITDDRHNAVEALRARIDSICEGLAVEARLREEGLASETRLREEAVQRVEAQCRQAREDAANAAPAAAAAATSAAGVNASAMERQLKAVLTEVRSDADRAESGRREESQRRREAEVALQRLRGELDVLREELMRRNAVCPISSPPPAMEVVTNAEELPQSGALRAAAAMAVPEGPPSVMPKATPLTTPPPQPARVMRFSSGPTRERAHLSTAEVFRWPSPPHVRQATSPPREKTAVPVLVESAISPRRAASATNRATLSSPPREPPGRRAMVAGAAAPGAPPAAVSRVSMHGTPRVATPPQSGRTLALPGAPGPSAAAAAEWRTGGIPAATCSFCGNLFMHDAVFCRKCGAKRGKEEVLRTSAALPGGAPGQGQELAPQPRQGMMRAASAGTLRAQGASQPPSAASASPAVVTLAAPSWPSGIASGRTLSPTTEAVSSATISMSMESNVTSATAQLDEVMS